MWQLFSMSLIVVNIVILSLVHYDQEDPENDGIGPYSFLTMNFINAFFFVEIILKMIAFEAKEFFKSPLNVIDIILSILFITVYIIDQSIAGQQFILNREDLLVWTA